MSFSKQLTAFVNGSKDKIDRVVKDSTQVLFKNVIMETPVKDGAARGNWQVSIDEPITGVIDRKDKEGSATVADAFGKIPDEAGHVVYMTNNLPYIRKLEYGHSDQAPQGMVRTNAAKWPQIVQEQAAKHK